MLVTNLIGNASNTFSFRRKGNDSATRNNPSYSGEHTPFIIGALLRPSLRRSLLVFCIRLGRLLHPEHRFGKACDPTGCPCSTAQARAGPSEYRHQSTRLSE